MSLEGRIDIRLERHGAAPATVSIHSTRPQLAQKLLGGRTPEEAAHLAGLIFSLCGKAQRVAAQAACEAAAGREPEPAVSRERESAVLMELAQEHAWRLLLDWPRQQGMQPDQASLLRLRQAAGDAQGFAAALDDLLRTTLLGEPVVTWLVRDLAGFDAWCRAAGTPTARLFAELGEGADVGVCSAPGSEQSPEPLREGAEKHLGRPGVFLENQVGLLPPLQGLDAAAAHELARRALDTPAFCGRPLWHDAPAETGALARVREQPPLAAWIALRGRGAGARLLARLLELAALPARLSGAGPALVRAWRLGDNEGLAGVETSRGLLLHVARLCEGKVAEYRIVAPTEWNFHPAGPLYQALAGLAPGGDLAARARLIAQSLDPCVAYGIEVNDA